MLLDKLLDMEKPEETPQDQRSQTRRRLVYYLRVFDRQGGGMMGHLVDLTTEGLMLVCPRPLVTGHTYRLRLVFPERIADRGELLFEGICRWCRPDVNPDLYAAGLQIQGLHPEDGKFLLCLIDDFAFND